MKKTIAPGIRQDAYGFEAAVTVGSGKNKLRAKPQRFPPPTASQTVGECVAKMQVWQSRERMRLLDEQKRSGGKVVRGTLSADKIEFLKKADLSADMRVQRSYQLDWWIQVFPNRDRHSLKANEIMNALKGLRTNKKPSRAAAAGTKNHYRMALLQLFVVLDGKHAPNPVRDVVKFDEPEPLPRDQSYELIDRILANLRDTSSRGGPSATKIRLRILAYAPLTPVQLERMDRTDIDWRATDQAPHGAILAPGRHKGAGTDSRRKPLTADALAAFRDFDSANLWRKPWLRPSVLNAFRRARGKAIAQLQDTRPDLVATAHRMRPYDLRHSFGSFVYRTTGGDIHATAEMLDHKNTKTTERYTKAAISEHLAAVGRQVAAAMSDRPKAAPPAAVVPGKAGLPSTTTVLSKKPMQNAEQNRKVLKHGRTADQAARRAKTA